MHKQFQLVKLSIFFLGLLGEAPKRLYWRKADKTRDSSLFLELKRFFTLLLGSGKVRIQLSWY